MPKTMDLEVAANGVGWLRFIVPERRNPFNLAFAAELTAMLSTAAERDDLRVLVLTGGEHFCCGGDLKEFRSIVANGARASLDLMEAVNRAVLAAYTFPKPVISAVRGVAFGAGMSLAMSADLMIAAQTARFCQAFIRIGGCPDTGSSWLLQRRVGAAQARKLILTGRELDGMSAAAMGLSDEAVPDEAVEQTALELAQEIGARSLFALISAKQVVRETAESGFVEALNIERRAQALLLQGHDFPEAMAAFAERRVAAIKDF
ncbi:enoyl-CoA hydratase/isomerase family protein [Bradyrhizobium genosp. SA-3]|uniref:enoyl-CoA hydratase/isomerase family protein n=1 Tax=Bradyrhizobium genosp. SA-3 TaxID=508868 RepID=UPI001FE133CD|nr:enoyl-CoA hydratase/isomerase family protein [Bradyrhizobium genosp. SA-3]